jgi:hypothetical protein
MSLNNRIESEGALGISNAEYLLLVNPIFLGQTSVNKEGRYKMYWERIYSPTHTKIYFTTNTL